METKCFENLYLFKRRNHTDTSFRVSITDLKKNHQQGPLTLYICVLLYVMLNIFQNCTVHILEKVQTISVKPLSYLERRMVQQDEEQFLIQVPPFLMGHILRWY